MSVADGFVAGSIAGMAGVVVGHPFDTIKVRLQTSQAYKGVTHCATLIFTKEGPTAFYKGMIAPMASATLMNAVFFGVYTSFLQTIDDDMDTPKIRSTWLAGTVSGFLAGCISGPTELIKCRLQVSEGKVRMSNIETIRNILNNDGIRGMGRGLGVTIFRETISCGIYFSTYEVLIQVMRGPNKSIQELSPLHLVLAGGISGMTSWGLNYPVDVVKSKVQTDGAQGPRLYKTSLCAARDLRALAGIPGFYKGVSATLIRAFPTSAVMLPAYSMTLSLLNGLRSGRQLHY